MSRLAGIEALATETTQIWPGDFSLRVPFRDVDMHRHVHNAVYLSYCETAVTEFLRDKALSEHFATAGHGIAYYVRSVESTFNKPSTFEDELCFHVAIRRVGGTSITFGVDVYGRGETLCRVKTSIVWVCVDVRQQKPVAVPAETRRALLALEGDTGPSEPIG